MMIAHASIPSDNPENAANVLAEIMGGEAFRFPPGGANAWMAWSGDGEVEIEVIQRGKTIVYTETQGEWSGPTSNIRSSECHVAICVDRPAAEIIAIATKAGWPARACDRGNGLFQLSEVWVDGAFMLEILDPTQTARYESPLIA